MKACYVDFSLVDNLAMRDGTREAAKELDVTKRKKRFDEEEELRVAEIGRLRKELAEVTQELSDMKVAWDERDKRDEEERLAREAAAAAAAAKDPKGGKKK